MTQAICRSCIDDPHVRIFIEQNGSKVECDQCGESDDLAVSVEKLGKFLEPVMRRNFAPGEQYKVFHGDDDRGDWIQQGETIEDLVQEVLGQYLDANDSIADAVVAADVYFPSRGGGPFWDHTTYYIPRPIEVESYIAKWQRTVEELKYSRRFFSASARDLFASLFADIDHVRERRGTRSRSVVRKLPEGTRLYRARISGSPDDLESTFAAPLLRVGPPPKEVARAGRMNADGVVVLYAATEPETARAELRPALKTDIFQIALETTRPLRVLDFSRLEAAKSVKDLSYFQPDYRTQRERGRFLQLLHTLIAKPVVPGREADYLITQTMAEYLAHVHETPFDGILFASAQRAGGTNVVLFADPTLLTGGVGEQFRVQYMEDSLEVYSTEAIKYAHRKLDVIVSTETGKMRLLDRDFGLDF
ncbi:RES domain-containing protein [Cupriavidus sp. HMR-1]|uniref:RES domain-containing protein n=1 Tax=Cupriavidus sp. HMR-1 TaxID=1249621 RepID=UPI0002D4DB41|nr:RES domain-containing protein [Cupriavidus sp. HMR-1]